MGSCGILGLSLCAAGLFLSCIMIPLNKAAPTIFQRNPNRWTIGQFWLSVPWLIALASQRVSVTARYLLRA